MRPGPPTGSPSRRGYRSARYTKYFPNKDAILRALMDSHLDAGTRLLSERLSGGLPEKLEDTLRVFVRAAIDNHRDNPRLHRVLFEEAPRAPEFLERLHEFEQLSVEATVRLLEQHPDVRSCGRLNAHIVVTTIESLVHRLIASQTPALATKLALGGSQSQAGSSSSSSSS